jgi:hypothetical protein
LMIHVRLRGVIPSAHLPRKRGGIQNLPSSGTAVLARFRVPRYKTPTRSIRASGR